MNESIHASESEFPGKGPSPSIVDEPARALRDLSSRARFLNACRAQPVDRPPIWLMRQAGRALPEYRALKESHTFVELVQTPDLAAEVTLQPIRRFGFDAAILFSDILVIAEGMGQSYRFREGGGIEMEFAVDGPKAVDRLDPEAVEERLQYACEALSRVRGELAGKTALIGFAGSPWTLANFMMEGGSAREFTRAKALYYEDRSLFDRFMEKIAKAVTRFLEMQIRAGADAVQIFDTLGGSLAPSAFWNASGRWIQRIVQGLEERAPVIVFSKGVHSSWSELAEIGSQALGVDWMIRMDLARRQTPKHIALQGNFDPFLLTTTPERVREEARAILDQMAGQPGHIFNLGHGVPPSARLENIEALVETVRNAA